MAQAPSPIGRTRYEKGALVYTSKGARRRLVTDLYHHLLRTTWPRLLLLLLVGYVAVNSTFALLYRMGGDCIRNARPGSFADEFWFSVQTFATIGYGELSPRTAYANVLVTLEAFLGLVSVALGTGLMFSKFSRPRALIGFSKNLVVGPRNGSPCLQFRMANERSSNIVEARVTVAALCDELSAEGAFMRRLRPLKLERGESPIFALSWTVFHTIDPDSPLFGITAENADQKLTGLIVTFIGLDEAAMQTVHARHVYSAGDLLFGHRFVDMMGTAEDGGLLIDHGKLHAVTPVADDQ
jgi:inward rectifier potassium channel